MRPPIYSLITLTLPIPSSANPHHPGPPSPPPYPPAPPTPPLSFLYSLNITATTPLPVGPGPRGTRLIFSIISGTFSGPRLRGTVIPGAGGDMALLDANNPDPLETFTPDIRMVLVTDDGEYIYVTKSGELQADGRTIVRIGWETGSEKYYWVNGIVGVGVVRRLGEFPSQELGFGVWKVELPPL